MASRDFRDLAEAQQKTAEALRTLTSQLRKIPQAGEIQRVAGPLVAQSKDTMEVRSHSAVPGSVETLALSTRGLVSVEQALNQTARSVQDLGSFLSANTKALQQNGSILAGGVQSLLAGFAGSARGGGGIGSLFGSGLGLVPLGLKLAGLFGGKKREPETLPLFELPPSLSIEAANADNILAGLPRVVRGQHEAMRTVEAGASDLRQPHVVVNVNALDTQSFLDRSSDIARAMRDAMLHMHPVNDMISEI